ncbi:hypothetical protein INR49_025620 [Caranx melampygus]|nr:hypothetical protein INR49_025620 [Caranx melampygus]
MEKERVCKPACASSDACCPSFTGVVLSDDNELTFPEAAWDSTTGSEKATGGRDELGLLLSTVVWPVLTGLLGWGRFWRKFGSLYSDKSILWPRLGRVTLAVAVPCCLSAYPRLLHPQH